MNVDLLDKILRVVKSELLHEKEKSYSTISIRKSKENMLPSPVFGDILICCRLEVF